MKNRVIIIAEAGVNHNGSLEKALQLVRTAKDAGADIVKFQTFKADKLVTKDAEKARYQKENTDSSKQYEMLKSLELTAEMHYEIIKECKKVGITFLSTPFDITSLEFLLSLGMNTVKVPSGEITNYPLLKKISEYKVDVILSTGMSKLGEVENAIDVLGNENKITLLHCNTQYPSPYSDANLKAIVTLKNAFGLNVGYSDHTEGIECPVAAVALGATIIEKHFTLEKDAFGPDHKASLNPTELKEMINSIRNIESALGNGIKKPSDSEKENIVVARKSIVAKENIRKGDIFSENNLTTKRPGNGISPMRWQEIIGTISMRDYKKDDLIVI